MKKFNKKGFTLVEMLVVIAIIAVLVAIIVPTVSKSTAKAAAATNAANLRSIAAEAAIDKLNNATDDKSGYVYYDGSGFVTNDTAPKAKDVGNVKLNSAAAVVVENDGIISATYDGYTVENFTSAAESGTLSKSTATSSTGGGDD